jgi:glyoxylase-like metal-dependent hydrolase (beta-lactamase superfamily II)
VPERILAEQAERGIHCLPVPTPFAVGRINCYLIEGDPLTLIDAGPRSDRSLSELIAMVEDTGNRVEDIGLVVATHQHIDHIGLINAVVERSGAEVAALDKAAARLAEFGMNSEAEDDLAVSLMLSHGVSEDIANTLKSLSTTYRDYGDAVTVTRPLPDGGTLHIVN